MCEARVIIFEWNLHYKKVLNHDHYKKNHPPMGKILTASLKVQDYIFFRRTPCNYFNLLLM